MKRLTARIVALSMIGNFFAGSGIQQISAEDESSRITSVAVEGKDRVTITLTHDAEGVSFNDFSIEESPRIVVDVSDSELAINENTVPGPEGSIIKQVRSAQHSTEPEKIVRIVLDLKKLVEYKVEKSGMQLNVIINNPGGSGGEEKTQTVAAEYDEYTSAQEAPTLYDREAPADEEEEIAQDEMVSIVDNLSSQPVTLDFNQADLADVFRILSAKSGINIIFGEDVEGELSIHLEQVPFKEAFKTILSLKSLVAQQVGKNILRIITPEALATQRSKSVTFWRVFPLNYADVKDAKKQIDGIRGAEGRRGTIEIDSRTNSLIVADSPEGLDDVARLISEIDLKPEQVLIEARFVEVSLDNRLDIGVEWGYYNYKVNGDKTTEIGSAKIETGKTIIGGLTGEGVTPTQATGVTAPIPGAVGSFQFGIIESGEQALLARLTALASEGKAKFLSNPKITTLNNQEASIWIGSQIPIRTTIYSETATSVSVVYKQVGIELKVTPTINVDNRITLKVRPEVSLPDTANITLQGDVPINTRYAIEEQKTEGITKVPLLGDIPVLGQFFRSNVNTKTRRELLVFITPKILRD